LALHAGGDLGAFSRWRTERHLAKCGQCREEVAAFSATREITTDLAELPDLNWNRLAAEMKANIRLGLAAGECVRAAEPALRDTRWFTGVRAAVAFASVVVLLVTGVFLEKPEPQVVRAEGTVVEKTAYGIQVSEGDEALGLMNRGAENVIYTVSAQGNMGARYVDPKTGYVTINNVYAQ
jgi:hypothetical protein